MAKSRIIWGVCLLFAFTLVFVSGGAVSLALLAAFTAVPVVLIVINQFAARGVSVTVEAPRTGEKGKPFTCHIKAVMGRGLPLGLCSCKLNIETAMTGENFTREILFPMGAKEQTVAFVLESGFCGCVAIRVKELRVYDIFGLTAVKLPCRDESEIAVLPDTFTPRIDIAQYMAMDAEADEYSPSKGGDDVSETFDIREYRPGDILNRIHWKLSWKFDEILIKEPGLPVRNSFLVLMDTAIPPYSRPDGAVSDALTEIYISFCQKLTEEEIRYEIGWQDYKQGSFFRLRINNLDELSGAMHKLLSTRHQLDEADALSYFARSGGEADFNRIIYISRFVPASFEQFSGKARITGVICTNDDTATGAVAGVAAGTAAGATANAAASASAAGLDLCFCSPENYERELFALSI